MRFPSLTRIRLLSVPEGSSFGLRILDLGVRGNDSDESRQSAGNGGSGVGLSSVTNNAYIRINSYTGLGFQAQGVLYESLGAAGGNLLSSENDLSGGSGGHGGILTGSNTGTTIEAIGNFDVGVALFRAESYGGQGGSALNLEGRGGDGGFGRSVNLTNSGFLEISKGEVTGGTQFRGIVATSGGGSAGVGKSGAGALGGTTGNVVVEQKRSSGDIEMTLGADVTQPTSIYGILAQTLGGNGGDSFKKNEDGGAGGDAGSVSVTAAAITLNAGGRNVAAGSAGVGAFTTGGVGGKAADGGSSSKSRAGRGGNAGPITVDVTDNIKVIGNGLLGINARALGGQGGGGTDNNASFSNNGGNAGAVSVTMADFLAEITTAGSGSTGIQAATIAGDGGYRHRNTPGTTGAPPVTVAMAGSQAT